MWLQVAWPLRNKVLVQSVSKVSHGSKGKDLSQVVKFCKSTSLQHHSLGRHCSLRVGDLSHTWKVLSNLCGYGKTIGRNTFEQNSSLNKADGERSWGHSALSYDYRILVAHNLKVSFDFWQEVGQGEKTGFPKVIQ